MGKRAAPAMQSCRGVTEVMSAEHAGQSRALGSASSGQLGLCVTKCARACGVGDDMELCGKCYAVGACLNSTHFQGSLTPVSLISGTLCAPPCLGGQTATQLEKGCEDVHFWIQRQFCVVILVCVQFLIIKNSVLYLSYFGPLNRSVKY